MTSRKQHSDLSEFDWNFDNVPENELVACCCWEYARESAFIRRIKQSFAARKAREKFNAKLWRHFERIDSIGYAAEVFLLGFFVEEVESSKASRPDAPLITGSFPGPWQSLSDVERKYRSHIRSDSEVIGLVPFKNGGDIITAECLLESAKNIPNSIEKRLTRRAWQIPAGAKRFCEDGENTQNMNRKRR